MLNNQAIHPSAAGADQTDSGYIIRNSILITPNNYLERTPAAVGNRTTWTFSCWVKRAQLDPTNNDYLFDAGVSNSEGIRFGNDNLYMSSTNGEEYIDTAALYRDITSWYHVVANRDTSRGTGERVRLYVNGERITEFAPQFGSRNIDSTALGHINNTVLHRIGIDTNSTSQGANMYIAEAILVDGESLDPTSFGEFNDNGVWNPIDPSGLNFGVNGFWLDFNSIGSGNLADATITNPNGDLLINNPASTGDLNIEGFTPSVWIDGVLGGENGYIRVPKGVTSRTGQPRQGNGDLGLPLNGQQIVVEYTEARTLSAIAFYMDNGGSNDQSCSWRVAYSDDGTNYTNVGTPGDNSTLLVFGKPSNGNDPTVVGDDGLNSDTQRYRAVPNAATNGAHTYWRITLEGNVVQGTTSGNFASISGGITEVRFYENDGDQLLNLGSDTSGNGNHFTSQGNLIQTTDTPTDDAEDNIGNYWTLNPFQSTYTLTNGNLSFTGGAFDIYATAQPLPKTGKWYWELEAIGGDQPIGTSASYDTYVGVIRTGATIPTSGHESNTDLWVWGNLNPGPSFGNEKSNGIGISLRATTGFADNSIVMVAVDMDTRSIWWGNDGVWAEGDPATGTGASYTNLPEEVMPFQSNHSDLANYNFGQHGFDYTPPTGFLALNTANIPEPVVANPEEYFQAVAYTGRQGLSDNIVPILTSNTSAGGLAFSSDAIVGRTTLQFGVFNGTATGWNNNNNTYPHRIGYRFPAGESYVVKAFSVSPEAGGAMNSNIGTAYQRSYGTFFIEGSNDANADGNTGTWTQIGPSTTMSVNQWRDYFSPDDSSARNGGYITIDTSDNTTAYSAFRLVINGVASGAASSQHIGVRQLVFHTEDRSRNEVELDFNPDLVWIKARNNSTHNILVDSIRGGGNYITSNNSIAEVSDDTIVSSFSTVDNGFTLGGLESDNAIRWNGFRNNYIAWCMKAGGAAVANTDGSNASMVSVADHGGFSIGTYTGSNGNGTVGHGLTNNPSFIAIKATDQAHSWSCWHKAVNGDRALRFDSNNGEGQDQTGLAWQNNPIATPGVITLGNQTNGEGVGAAYVFYAWADVPGLIDTGSYIGNGNIDGPFIYTGFKPAFVMTKRLDAVSNWQILDNVRDTYNPIGFNISPNLTGGDPPAKQDYVDFLSNGYKIRTLDNVSGGRYMYLAFAETPFDPAGRPQVRAR